MWEDTTIIIAHRKNPPDMKTAQPVGPAVHFGPYRALFNQDVTISIPYDRFSAPPGKVKPYIYNHLTKDWDEIDGAKANFITGTVTFKTQVLGLFRAGVK